MITVDHPKSAMSLLLTDQVLFQTPVPVLIVTKRAGRGHKRTIVVLSRHAGPTGGSRD